jgi:nicotinate-nucleotide adenylyltransferase
MIGVFGGTFDPIHYGHLRSALEVKGYFGLAELHLIPSAQPPHRGQPSASAAQRLHMLALAVNGHPGFVIDNRELKRPGRSYMIDTLTSLQQQFAGQSLLLIIGMDAFKALPTWHRWQELFALAHVLVMTRPGYQHPPLDDFFADKLAAHKTELTSLQAGKLFFLPVTPLDISATAIRALIAEQRNPGFLLPDAVIGYINQHGLYNRPTL